MTKINNKLAQRALSFLVLMALVAGSVIPAFAQRRRTRRSPRLGRYTRPVVTPPSTRYYTLSANQTMRVRMADTITSRNARIGDRFRTTTVDPIYAGGVEVIPAASTIIGRVTSVKRAARKSKAGTLGVEFISLQLPNGTTRAINGSLTDVNGENNSYDEEGQVTGRSSTKRNIVFIGGGAATGALIGAIAGGGKGAGIGAGVGAGLGVAGAFFSKGKEAEVRPGTEFGVVLNQSISLPASNAR
jgi:hypothetical protein